MEGRLSLGQYLILVILLLGQLHGFKSCIQKESKALLELKKYIISTNQEEFSDYVLPTWTNDTKSDCCQWEGVECNRTNGRVIALSVGRLFPRENFLLNLSLLHPFEDIRNLSLSPFRDIQDRPSIPVKEYNNQFSGFFDNVEGNNSLRRFRNLEILDLSFNKFNNSILPFLTAATSLTALSLKNNDIYGPAKVFCQMKNLKELNLRGNHFEGQLPLCLGSLKKLQVLDLSSNQFSGNLPSIFSSLESIEYLSLSDNNYTGLFGLNPLTNLTKLKVFKLSSTSDMVQVEIESSWQPTFQLSVAVLRSCSLEKIPSFLMYQKNLHLVDLSNNRLSGYIPTWLLENNPELEVLQLQNNSFTLFQMTTIVHNLQVLDFSSNAIEIFPVNIGKALPNLVHMNGSSNGFQGYFPSSIGEMKNISFLDLSSNNFSGKVPRSFVMGCISLKYLKLSHNKFSGRFLSSGTSFASLDGLIINNNLFTGKIGDGLISSSELFILDASNNFLRGAIPSWIYNSELQFLVLSNNLLEGTLPPSLLAMTFLDISGNLFSGALPAPPVGSISPKNLFLNNNNFTGPIPETLLDGVNILDLSNNKLSGSIPQFVNTQDISILLLRGNDLTGPIPRELCDLSNIKLLDLSNNKLNGFIPSCLYNLSLGRGGVGEMGYYRAYLIANLEWEFYKSTIVVENFVVDSYITYKEIKVKFATKQRYDSYSGRSEFSDGILDLMYGIDLSSNELSGVIPANLGNLSSVRALNFSHNFLSSSIPSSFSNLKVIESLDLSYNKLHGSIPYQLTSLTYLAVFDVSHNNLSGIIPQGRQFNTFSENSYLGNPLLCGPPTHISCEAKKSSEERDNGGGEEETEAAIDMLVFYYSTASVYVTALVGIVVLVCFDCPWRRAWLRIVDAFITSVKNVLS